MKNKTIILFIIIFSIISILSIYSSSIILSSNYKYLFLKQLLWYLLGFIITFIIFKNKKGFFFKYDKLLYFIGILLLILVLIIGSETNGSKAWFEIPGLGTFQPSEFMKIFLIITLSKELDKYKNIKKTFKNEFLIIVRCFLITLLPSILTFLEPDTGNVIIYFIILITTLFIFGIRYRWFIISISIILVLCSSFLFLYFYKEEVFIRLFGTDFFYRMDRILEWKNNEGMQLENALSSIGSAPIEGYGIGKTPLYIPEAQTDFISAIIFSNFGYIISIIILLLIILFDIGIIRIIFKLKPLYKYLLTGIITVIIFQQIQNISMNLGLLPITGITLPFISYGGSSLISYMIMIGIILNINKKTNK